MIRLLRHEPVLVLTGVMVALNEVRATVELPTWALGPMSALAAFLGVLVRQNVTPTAKTDGADPWVE